MVVCRSIRACSNRGNVITHTNESILIFAVARSSYLVLGQSFREMLVVSIASVRWEKAARICLTPG